MKTHFGILAFVVATAFGCSEQPLTQDTWGSACTPSAAVTCSCPDGSRGTATCDADGLSVGVCSCGPGNATGGSGGALQTTGGSGGSTGGTGSQPATAGGSGGTAGAPTGGFLAAGAELPCEVRAIISEHCGTCHTSPTKFGAPMPLVSEADFRAIAPMSTETVAQRVLARVTDDAKAMPPTPNPRLTAAEIDVLRTWIDAGVPDGTCTTDPPMGTGGMGGSGSTDPLPPDVTCYTLTARASASGDKYSVPTTPDMYRCFDYTPPWGNKEVQVVAARPIIDNDRVLHHWILYNRTANVTDGTNAECFGAHPDASFITGWAPGGDGMHLPDDVGLRTEAGGFTLELHYNNTIGAGELDASGVEVCVTEKFRPKEAAVHWLGSQNLNKITATGTCTPINTEPVTIISSSPHMHLQGRHMKTVINRKAGGTEVLIDKPFDFSTQVSYDTPAVIQPGDTLTTTCTFATPTPFGTKTNEEMCYNFVVAYPAGQLAQFLQILRKYDCTGL
jgi:hypothetical protein